MENKSNNGTTHPKLATDLLACVSLRCCNKCILSLNKCLIHHESVYLENQEILQPYLLRAKNEINQKRREDEESRMTRTRIIGSILTIVAFLLWLSSIYQAKLAIRQGIGNLGLASILPTTFFVSVSLLTVSFFVTLKSGKQDQILLFFQTITLIFILSFTPAIIENTARFITTYSNYRSVDYISQNKHIDPSAQWIHNWPSFSIAYSALMQITALPEQMLLSIYPTFFNIALFFPLFIFFHLILDDEKLRWVSIWTFYIANWVGQDYFSMQSLGFFTFVLILFVLFKLMNSRVRTRHWCVTLILFFSLVVTSHMLSSLAVLAVIFVFFASKYFRKPVFVALFVFIFASWTTYGAATYLQWNLPRFMAEALNFELIFQANVAARVAGSVARIMVTQIRLIFSALIVIFAFCGLVLTWNRGKMGDVEKKILFIFLGVFLLLGFSAYGGELFMRIFLFSLVPSSYFISKGLNLKTFFCLFAIFLIIVAPPLYMIAHHGNETLDYVPPSEIRGVEFFYNATTHGYVIGGAPRSGNFRDFKYRQSYGFFSFSDSVWENDMLTLGWFEPRYMDWPVYVCLSYGTKEYYDFFIGKPEFAIDLSKNMTESTHYNRIYSNPSLDVYYEL